MSTRVEQAQRGNSLTRGGAIVAWSSGLVKDLRRNRILYLMVIPGVLYFLVFRYVPMYGAIIAFKNYRILQGFTGSPWVGLKNFETVFSSTYFTSILVNTLLISFYKLIIGTPLAVLTALLLNEVRARWFKRTVQTVTYLPHFLSWVVVFGVALQVLSPSNGLANKAIVGGGGEPINFLADPH